MVLISTQACTVSHARFLPAALTIEIFCLKLSQQSSMTNNAKDFWKNMIPIDLTVVYHLFPWLCFRWCWLVVFPNYDHLWIHVGKNSILCRSIHMAHGGSKHDLAGYASKWNRPVVGRHLSVSLLVYRGHIDFPPCSHQAHLQCPKTAGK